ncbi:MAG: hypothetical protein Q9218_003315 [Villophora microphyllina]
MRAAKHTDYLFSGIVIIATYFGFSPVAANPINPNPPKIDHFTDAILGQPLLMHKNLTANPHAQCFDPPMHPLLFHDCVTLIRSRLGFPHNDDELLSFSRRSSANIHLPYLVRSNTGNCQIFVTIGDDRLNTITTTFRKIKAEAVSVAVECVVRGDHLGGFGWIGRQEGEEFGDGQLLISVVARERPRVVAAVERREIGDGNGDRVYAVEKEGYAMQTLYPYIDPNALARDT